MTKGNNLNNLSNHGNYSDIIFDKKDLNRHENKIADNIVNIDIGGTISGSEVFSVLQNKTDCISVRYQDMNNLRTDIKKNIEETNRLILKIRLKILTNKSKINENNAKIADLSRVPESIYQYGIDSEGKSYSTKTHNPAYDVAQAEIASLREENVALEADNTALEAEKSDLSTSLSEQEILLNNVEELFDLIGETQESNNGLFMDDSGEEYNSIFENETIDSFESNSASSHNENNNMTEFEGEQVPIEDWPINSGVLENNLSDSHDSASNESHVSASSMDDSSRFIANSILPSITVSTGPGVLGGSGAGDAPSEFIFGIGDTPKDTNQPNEDTIDEAEENGSSNKEKKVGPDAKKQNPMGGGAR